MNLRERQQDGRIHTSGREASWATPQETLELAYPGIGVMIVKTSLLFSTILIVCGRTDNSEATGSFRFDGDLEYV